jgi:predicted RNA-binding Zn-ribbon protein involved in translation (DUF1610 family)
MRVLHKISDDRLREVVAEARSIMDVLRRLGYKSLTGGTHSHISRRVKKAGIDTAHFLTAKEALRKFRTSGKLAPESVLVINESGRREAAFRLRRALIESGTPYICSQCAIGPEWNGKSIVLEVDHKNNNFVDNRAHNLRFLCPNCHSQVRHAMNKGFTTVTQGSWAKKSSLTN